MITFCAIETDILGVHTEPVHQHVVLLLVGAAQAGPLALGAVLTFWAVSES